MAPMPTDQTDQTTLKLQKIGDNLQTIGAEIKFLREQQKRIADALEAIVEQGKKAERSPDRR